MSGTLKVYTTKEKLYRIKGLGEIRNCLPSSSEIQDLVTFLKDSSNIDQLVCTAEYVLKNRIKASQWQKNNPDKARKRFSNWKLKNIERLISVGKIYRDMNRKKILVKNKAWKIKNPEYMRLRSNYDGIRNRCNNSKNPLYKYYGGKGIKCLMSFADYCELLQKYNYKTMKQPSIDRIDSNSHYSVSNCQIIERSENSKRRIAEHGNPNKRIKNITPSIN